MVGSDRPDSHSEEVRAAARQQQFLNVVERDVAFRTFLSQLVMEPLGTELVRLGESLDRVLADDVVAAVDVSGFDRSNVDGFAIRAVDTFGAMEESPRFVLLNGEVITPGKIPAGVVSLGTATPIATGAVLPRGADAVLMIEHTDLIEHNDLIERGLVERGEQADQLQIMRAVSSGQNVTFAGTDIANGETVLRAGMLLTSREIGVLAAIGRSEIPVFRRPRVAVISTGNEIVAPDEERPLGYVYDSNLAILSAAVRELGGEPVPLGIVRDDEERLQEFLDDGLQCDVVVLSGGTSKGAGDLSYRVVSRLDDPGIVVHGVALKPGKPVCLAVTNGTPVVVLPGFPTSAIFTFHEFVAPVIRAFGGRSEQSLSQLSARLPMRVNSERGRTEYLLVNLVGGADFVSDDSAGDDSVSGDGTKFAAYPMGKGSGSVTTFSGADGFITIDSQTEIVEPNSLVDVQLLSRHLQPADFVAIGSHCVGFDFLLGELERRGMRTKVMSVGSLGGLSAASRGECDVAGIHLLDPKTGEYNCGFVSPGLKLLAGYGRMQGIVYRAGDVRFVGKSVEELLAELLGDAAGIVGDGDDGCRMINRNAGSGTRILIDRLLGERWSALCASATDGEEMLAIPEPAGYAVQAKSHNAVAAAVQQGRADWGVAIETVSALYGLAFLPICEERYDFVVPCSRWERRSVIAFRELLAEEAVRAELVRRGFRL